MNELRTFVRCKTCGLTFNTGMKIKGDTINESSRSWEFACPLGHKNPYSVNELIIEEGRIRRRRVAGRLLSE